MAWYRAGSVGATNGNKNITGASTAWVNNVQPGDAFIGPDGAYYEVDLVNSNTSITLVENYAGTTVASGGAYKIIPTQGRVRDMAAAVLQLITDYGAVESALTVSGGNVGLAISPTERLHVNGNMRLPNNATVKIDNTSASAQVLLTLGVDNNVYTGQVSNPTAGSMFLYGSQIVFTGAAELARLSSAGLVVPAAIQSKTNAGATPKISLFQTGVVAWEIENQATTGTFGVYNGAGYAFRSESVSSGVTGIYVGGNGSVGIGTTSPGSMLHLHSPSGGDVPRMRFTNGTTGTGSTAGAFVGISNSRQLNIWNHENEQVRIAANGIVRAIIKPFGQLNLVPLSSDPSGAAAGDLYFNSTTSKFRGYTGSAWVDLH